MMTGSETQPLPEGGDYHKAKRDLLRRGVERGYVRASEIRQYLPPPHFSIAELELVYFALEALGVMVIEDEPAKP